MHRATEDRNLRRNMKRLRQQIHLSPEMKPDPRAKDLGRERRRRSRSAHRLDVRLVDGGAFEEIDPTQPCRRRVEPAGLAEMEFSLAFARARDAVARQIE